MAREISRAWPETLPAEDLTIDTRLKRLFEQEFGDRVSFAEPLSKYTSLRVGGPADALLRPQSSEQFQRIVRLCLEESVPLTVLGGGFNTLVRDGGIRGVVIRTHGLRTLELQEDRIVAEAGVTHSTLAKFSLEHGLSGLEFAVGIPGTIGGWLKMNAGIPSREMKDVVAAIEYLKPHDGSEVRKLREDLRFRYRELQAPESALLLRAEFLIEMDDPSAIRARQQELLAARKSSQPVDQLSCGSVFTNPPGDHAGRLIEAAGLKGAVHGGAQISELHANFIVNRGQAHASDVLALIARAREAVDQQFQIELVPEVHVMGEDHAPKKA